MSESTLQVAVLGAGKWAEEAHIPGWIRDPRAEIVAICDPILERAEAFARKFDVPEFSDDWQATVSRGNVDVIDVCTPSRTHFDLAWAALEAGKHVLCEKPVSSDYRETRRAAEFARGKGLKTKLGFTFRYSPGVRYAWSLIQDGFVGTPFIFDGYDQNSQWLDPRRPAPPGRVDADPNVLQVRSLEGYGASIMDIGHWWVGADYSRGSSARCITLFPSGRVRDLDNRMTRINVDDATVFLTEYANGATVRFRRAMSTIGNYSGTEARIYGDKGAIICRMVEEFGVAETIKVATPDDVEFRELEIPDAVLPGRWPSWRILALALLRQSDPRVHRRDPGRRAKRIRRTSTTARGCRKQSTPLNFRFVRIAGSTCPSTSSN